MLLLALDPSGPKCPGRTQYGEEVFVLNACDSLTWIILVLAQQMFYWDK